MTALFWFALVTLWPAHTARCCIEQLALIFIVLVTIPLHQIALLQLHRVCAGPPYSSSACYGLHDSNVHCSDGAVEVPACLGKEPNSRGVGLALAQQQALPSLDLVQLER